MDFSVVEDDFRLLDNLPVGICVINAAYEIVVWNNCLKTWTKKTIREVGGKTLGQVYPHFLEERYTARIDPILEGGPPAIFSSQLHGRLFPCALPNGKSRILQTTVTHVPKKDGDGFYALFAVTDLTEVSYRIMDYRKVQQKALTELEQRKAVEDELRKANEKILAQHKAVIEEERLKVLLQMAGATAHELNQPLMILLGNIELLEMDLADPEKMLGRIKKISEAGSRISDIIKKIQKVKHVVKKDYTGGEDIIDIHQQERILFVEDDLECYRMVRRMLTFGSQREIHHADTIKAAKVMVKRLSVDLILLDYILPDGDAFDLLEFMKEEHLDIPVVVLTGHGSEITASQLFRKGVSDYLSKARLDRESLLESVEFSLERHNLNRDKEKAMLVMGDLSTKDKLTGLYNRRYFDEAFDRETSGTDRYNTDLALCLIDLDYFKDINDTYGHGVGDQVLKTAAGIILAAVRKYDIACRYGGEEFALILPNTDQDGALTICNRIRENLKD
ncbi:MAG TPA: hypothetical protein DHV36_14920, partial [Desulfobacteraceae bacterium]|nr:hypothetical protein [Desulfobacteraceae bacterium]